MCGLNKMTEEEKQFESKPGQRDGAMAWWEMMWDGQTCGAVPAWNFPKGLR